MTRRPYARMTAILPIFLLTALLAAVPTDARAQASYIKGPPPVDQVYYRNTSVVRMNPIGLMNDFRFGYRHRLFESNSPLLKGAYVGAQASLFASPAFVRPGIIAELAPLSILQLSMQYEFLGAFGSFGTLRSFGSAADVGDHADTIVIGSIEDNGNYANTGQQITFGAMFQAKVPSSLDQPGLVFRNNYRQAWVQQNLKNGDRVYYDLVFDLIAPGNGWFAANDMDLLYMFSPHLTVGVRYTLTHAWYNDSHYANADEEPRANMTTHRVGPLVSYAFKVEDGATYNTPTLFALVNWWTSHPHRTGQAVAQAVPYLVLGFSFTGDLPGTTRPNTNG